MKKIISVILLIAILCTGCIALAACGGDDDKDNDGGKNGDASGSASIFYIEYKGVKIELGKPAEGIIEKLGAPSDKKEIGDCGGLGAQVKYSYPSIVIYTLKTDDGETIDQIDILDDLVTTSKGIYIGSASADVEKKHGAPNKSTDTSIQYISGNKYLKFGIENGEVKSISLLRVTG